jgi:histidine ammonia-lyase
MPASVGSIPTDANQEDFVPMGMGAAWKASRIVRNAAQVVSTELLCGAQGLEFLRPLKPGAGVARLYQAVRDPERGVAPLAADRPPAPDLAILTARVLAGELAPSYLP